MVNFSLHFFPEIADKFRVMQFKFMIATVKSET